MDTERKLEQLGAAAQYDLCGACINPKGDAKGHRQRGNMGKWIYPAVMPDGKHILLLKVLMSNLCENNCFYCVNRADNDKPQIAFAPLELAKLFMEMLNKRLVQGLFLSSGIYKNSQWSMDRMLKTVEILRFRYKFKGFIHLKILPGSSAGQIERAVRLASRVSVNLEAPSASRLRKIAPEKNFQNELLDRMRLLSNLIDKYNHGKRYGPKGQSTQFIVGAAKEADSEILLASDNLYNKLNLSRIYYSAFQPAKNTPLETLSATPFIREHRLYQADFLFRRYGFNINEIGFDSNGNLPLSKDPKMIWAENHPEYYPVEVNTASKETLLRVPGFGEKTVRRILKTRRENKIKYMSQLKLMGALVKNAQGYILLNGKNPGKSSSSQRSIWETDAVTFGSGAVPPF